MVNICWSFTKFIDSSSILAKGFEVPSQSGGEWSLERFAAIG